MQKAFPLTFHAFLICKFPIPIDADLLFAHAQSDRENILVKSSNTELY